MWNGDCCCESVQHPWVCPRAYHQLIGHSESNIRKRPRSNTDSAVLLLLRFKRSFRLSRFIDVCDCVLLFQQLLCHTPFVVFCGKVACGGRVPPHLSTNRPQSVQGQTNARRETEQTKQKTNDDATTTTTTTHCWRQKAWEVSEESQPTIQPNQPDQPASQPTKLQRFVALGGICGGGWLAAVQSNATGTLVAHFVCSEIDFLCYR